MPEAIDEQVRDLGHASRVLALIGASLKLRTRNDVDREIREQIDAGARTASGVEIGSLDERQAAQLVGMIEMTFAEAGELLRNPDRGSTWKVEDAALLQAQGQASRHVFGRILALAETRPSLQATLTGRFLDVGTGVGGIALEAAERCPGLRVDGIDIWEPALALAERNLAASPHADRVEVARCDVAALEPGRRYTLAWLPTMFMKRAVVERALDRIAAASVGGAYLIAALYTRPRDPVMAALSALRTLRSGGEVMEPAELEEMLRRRSYVDVETDVTPLATFILGRLP